MYKKYETEIGFSGDIKKELDAEIERFGVEMGANKSEWQVENIKAAIEKCSFITESIQAFSDPIGEHVPPFDFLEVVSFIARNTELIRPVRAFIAETYANDPEAGMAFDSKLGWTMVQWLS